MFSSLPTGTVTFLFTDVEGSTLLAQNYPAEMSALLAQHHAILRQSIDAYHGHIFRVIGDAFCAAFFTPADALQAAVQAQRQLQVAASGPGAVKIRTGIHTGPAQAAGGEEEAYAVYGYLTLARTERIMSTAYGGQILVSNPCAELLRGELPEGVELRDMGEHRLKGLLNPEHLWQVTAPGLASAFPPLRSLNFIPSNLPGQLSSFIGREQEIAETVPLLKTSRLVTLTGVGGSGKTRLSLQVAAEALEGFNDGVWFVELARLADPALLFQSVAATLGVREVPGRPLSVALIDFLRAKHLLLILDNCEHLIEACSQLADTLLSACPHLHILASSREALNIPGEKILQVPSLGLPDMKNSPPLEDLTRSEAIQLFLERTRSVLPGFALSGQTAQVVAKICLRLDGIPLAIELAAARMKVFTAEQILARLDDRFRLLTGGSRTALPRQQTLRALIDWSYDLLSEAEQMVFRRLSVFAGGWTFEAAEVVVGDQSASSLDLLELLPHLIDKSLVMVEKASSNATARYRFLETIRQYAGEKLLESGEAAIIRDRHLDYFLKLAEEIEPLLLGAMQLSGLEQAEAEHDNLRAALAWGLESDPDRALTLAGKISDFWNLRGYVSEGRDWLSRAIREVEVLPPLEGRAELARKDARARALLGLGKLIISQGGNFEGHKAFQVSAMLARQTGNKPLLVKALNLLGTAGQFLEVTQTNSIAVIEESAALAREIGDNWGLAMGLGLLAHYAWMTGDDRSARKYLEESIRLSHAVGDPWNTGMARMGFGMGATMQGNYAEARVHFEEGLALFRKIGDKYRVNMVLSELAHLERRQGNYDQALKRYCETLLAWQNLGHRGAVAHQLECIAFIASAQGNANRAAQLFGAAAALREAVASPMTPPEQVEYEQALQSLKNDFGEASFTAAWEKGQAMGMEEAIASAIAYASE